MCSIGVSEMEIRGKALAYRIHEALMLIQTLALLHQTKRDRLCISHNS